jgi:hypothetical protein
VQREGNLAGIAEKQSQLSRASRFDFDLESLTVRAALGPGAELELASLLGRRCRVLGGNAGPAGRGQEEGDDQEELPNRSGAHARCSCWVRESACWRWPQDA